jgi:hypothetical protein
LLLVGGARAEGEGSSYSTAEIEAYGRRVSLTTTDRESLFVVQGAYGLRAGGVAPYFGAGIGFFTFRLRAGVAFLPGNLRDPGLLARLEVRPQVVELRCLELGVLGQAAIGYRWPLEYRRPDEDVGPAIYLLPAFEAGPDWARAFCANTRKASGPPRAQLLLGGSLTMGFDW